jgi:hypothetical protein
MLRLVAAFGALAAAGLSSPAAAKDSANDWHFRTAAYVFMPDIDGKQSFPAPQDIHVDFSDLLKRTEFSFMGVFEARYQRVGAFADIIYLDLGDEKNDTDRLLTGFGGGVPLPPGITADLKFDAKTWIVTMGGFYRAIDSEGGSLDILAGARMNRNKARLGYAFSAPFGPFQGPLQQGSLGDTTTIWDAIIGTKGRVNFGRKREWFALGYADIGKGDSKRTWQVFVGGGRRFGRVDTLIGWRKLSYRPKSDSQLERISYSGPLIGASVGF